MSILYIADCLRDGRIFQKDLDGAERWYRVAIKSGSRRGVFGLAQVYLISGNIEQSIELLKCAVDRNYPPAMNTLAGIYFRGDGVKRDKTQALELWKRGAELGHVYCKKHLIGQSLRGEFGILRFVLAAILFVPMVFYTMKILREDRYGDRLR